MYVCMMEMHGGGDTNTYRCTFKVSITSALCQTLFKWSEHFLLHLPVLNFMKTCTVDDLLYMCRQMNKTILTCAQQECECIFNSVSWIRHCFLLGPSFLRLKGGGDRERRAKIHVFPGEKVNHVSKLRRNVTSHT